MKKNAILLSALAIFGIALLVWSLNTGIMIGSEWFGSNATSPWHMNNYIVLEAKYAYIFFGLATLAFGGLATGIAMPHLLGMTKTKGHKVASACAFFVAILLTGLGFNTLDFMLGGFYWTNMQYPPPVMVPVIGSIDVWNYYFFFFVMPLWLGGFIIGLVSSFAAFRVKSILPDFKLKWWKTTLKLPIQLTKPKEYVVESESLSRKNRRQMELQRYNV